MSGLLPNMVLPVRLTVPISKVRYNLRYRWIILTEILSTG